MEKALIKFSNWIKKNKFEALILCLILIIGAFLRLYKIADYMTFLGDEGRDVIVVRRLLVNFDPILVGPGTSIGNMYLGPLYYYLMAPALLLANYSPLGPAVQIALLGVATIFFIWFVSREWFPPSGRLAWGALIASGLYAISPTVAIFSRSSWNPNIMPFFALLSMYSIWRVSQNQEFKWLVVLGISYAFVLQSHYLGFLLLPVLAIFWLLSLIRLIRTIKPIRNFLVHSCLGLFLFLFLMSPLVIFDARYGFRNFSAMGKFFSERQTTISARPWNAIPLVWPRWERVSERLLTAQNPQVGRLVAVFVSIGFAVLVRERLKKGAKSFVNSPLLLLFLWVGFALSGLGLYKQEIYDHYYGFFFPAPFLVVGALSTRIIETKMNFPKVIFFVLVLFLVFLNLQNNALKHGPVKQLERTELIASKIASEAKGERFNLAVLAERNYEDAYQYFLEVWNTPVSDIDPQRYEETIGKSLFVVCELPPQKCDPTHSSKAEVANFGWSKIEDEWEVWGIKVYKLVHSQ